MAKQNSEIEKNSDVTTTVNDNIKAGALQHLEYMNSLKNESVNLAEKFNEKNKGVNNDFKVLI